MRRGCQRRAAGREYRIQSKIESPLSRIRKIDSGRSNRGGNPLAAREENLIEVLGVKRASN